MTETVVAVIRAKLNLPDVGTFIRAFAPLISPGGMFVRTRQLKEPGTVIRFDFSLASGERLLLGEGLVRQVRDGSDGSAAGMLVKFTKLNRASKDLVDRIVAYKVDASSLDAPEPEPVSVPTPEPVAAPEPDPPSEDEVVEEAEAPEEAPEEAEEAEPQSDNSLQRAAPLGQVPSSSSGRILSTSDVLSALVGTEMEPSEEEAPPPGLPIENDPSHSPAAAEGFSFGLDESEVDDVLGNLFGGDSDDDQVDFGSLGGPRNEPPSMAIVGASPLVLTPASQGFSEVNAEHPSVLSEDGFEEEEEDIFAAVMASDAYEAQDGEAEPESGEPELDLEAEPESSDEPDLDPAYGSEYNPDEAFDAGAPQSHEAGLHDFLDAPMVVGPEEALTPEPEEVAPAIEEEEADGDGPDVEDEQDELDEPGVEEEPVEHFSAPEGEFYEDTHEIERPFVAPLEHRDEPEPSGVEEAPAEDDEEAAEMPLHGDGEGEVTPIVPPWESEQAASVDGYIVDAEEEEDVNFRPTEMLDPLPSEAEASEDGESPDVVIFTGGGLADALEAEKKSLEESREETSAARQTMQWQPGVIHGDKNKEEAEEEPEEEYLPPILSDDVADSSDGGLERTEAVYNEILARSDSELALQEQSEEAERAPDDLETLLELAAERDALEEAQARQAEVEEEGEPPDGGVFFFGDRAALAEQAEEAEDDFEVDVEVESPEPEVAVESEDEVLPLADEVPQEPSTAIPIDEHPAEGSAEDDTGPPRVLGRIQLARRALPTNGEEANPTEISEDFALSEEDDVSFDLDDAVPSPEPVSEDDESLPGASILKMDQVKLESDSGRPARTGSDSVEFYLDDDANSGEIPAGFSGAREARPVIPSVGGLSELGNLLDEIQGRAEAEKPPLASASEIKLATGTALGEELEKGPEPREEEGIPSLEGLLNAAHQEIEERVHDDEGEENSDSILDNVLGSDGPKIIPPNRNFDAPNPADSNLLKGKKKRGFFSRLFGGGD